MPSPAIDARHPRWPTQTKATAGVVYVATGPAYVQEAREAALRLKKHNPLLPFCLITDHPSEPAFWDELVLICNPAFGFRDKILMGLCPFERFLFLDTDTTPLADISDLFELLLRFDFAGHQLFEGHDCPLPGIPDAFPEFNSGVLGFRHSPALNDFFARWLVNYDAFYALNRDGNYHYSNASDQKSLRQTVYESGLRITILGPEYNFVPHHLNFACSPVRILHSRGWRHLEELSRRLNARLGNRVYVPRLDTVVTNDMAGSELRRLWWMTTLQLLRQAAVALAPRGLRGRLRQNALVRRLFLRNRFIEPTPAIDSKWHRSPPADK
jgi:hypothetical protein